MTIRFARESDAAALLSIYREYIDTNITFETELPSVEEFRRRIGEYSSFYPYLVGVDDEGKIRGYAYAHKIFERFAYRFDVETTIYLDKEAKHTGLAKELYDRLLSLLKEMNVVNAYALVTGKNTESLAFHRKCGFKDFANFRNTGYKNGVWIDVIWLVRVLGDYSDRPKELRSINEIVSLQQ